jgi:hypothetical protein
MKMFRTRTKNAHMAFGNHAHNMTSMFKNLSKSALPTGNNVEFWQNLIRSATDTMTRQFKKVLQ